MRKFLVFFILVCACRVFGEYKTVDLISFATGVNNIFHEKYRTCEFKIEYKPSIEFHKFRPVIGFVTTCNRSFYANLGFCLDFVFYDCFLVSPGFSAGYYSKGKGKDLGYPLEFKTGIEVGWQFKNFYRVGVNMYHISNAGLGKRNPGEESLLFFISVPLSFKKYNKEK